MDPLKSNKDEMVAWLTIALTVADVMSRGLSPANYPSAQRVENAEKLAVVLADKVIEIGDKRQRRG